MIAIDHRFRIWCWLAPLLLVLPLAAFAQTNAGVGFSPITIHDPVNGGAMPGYVFYPSSQASRVTRVGAYELHATRDAPPIAGTKPLVVISHGHGGDDLEFRNMAILLPSPQSGQAQDAARPSTKPSTQI